MVRVYNYAGKLQVIRDENGDILDIILDDEDVSVLELLENLDLDRVEIIVRVV